MHVGPEGGTLDDATAAGIEQLSLDSPPPRFHWPYVYFMESSVETDLHWLLRSLGRQAPLIPLIDYLLQSIREDSHTASAILVLNGVVLGAAEQLESPQALRAMVELVMDTYLNCLSSASSPLLQCALVEGIGVLATALGKRFNGLELKALYALLAELGAQQWAVASCARGALWAVKEALGIDEGISALVSMHSDRLADLLSQRLMALALYPSAPNVSAVGVEAAELSRGMCQVLKGVISLCYPGLVMTRMLDDSLEALMIVLHQQHGEDHAAELLGIVNLMLRAVLKHQEASAPAEEQSTSTEPDDTPPEQPEQTDVDVEEEEPPVEPIHRIALAVLDECHVLLATDEPRVAVGAMECVNLALDCLRGRLNDLRPLAHQLWPRVLYWLRLQLRSDTKHEEPKHPAVEHALSLLCALVEHTGDFLAQRFFEHGFASICRLVRVDVSVRGVVWPLAYSFSHRTRLATLRLLRLLAATPDFLDRHGFQVCRAHALSLQVLTMDAL